MADPPEFWLSNQEKQPRSHPEQKPTKLITKQKCNSNIITCTDYFVSN